MGKSRADIQRAYRERKIAELGQIYHENEARRMRKYYVKTEKLTKEDLTKRRKKIKVAMRKLRQQRKVNNAKDNEQSTTSTCASGVVRSGPSTRSKR